MQHSFIILGIDTCGGDSGGPMVIRKPGGAWYQTGLVSYGSKICGSGDPSAYTKVSEYLDWIQKKLEP